MLGWAIHRISRGAGLPSLLLVLLLGFLKPNTAGAYPSFVGYGYVSCAVCHYNPLGNGPLTDYGRALSASEISGRLFVDRKTTDEQLGDRAGFTAGKVKIPDWIRPGFSYRGMLYRPDLLEAGTWRWVQMQADGSLVIQPSKKFFVEGTLGYAPSPLQSSASTNSGGSNWVSREHYVAFRPKNALGFYAGMMDVAFGLRIPDHIAFSRKYTLLAQNDQSHGLLIHHGTASWDAALHILAGNLFQSPDLRQRGLSFFAERDFGRRLRFGASFLATDGSFRARQMLSAHAKVGYGKGSSLLAELGLVRNKAAVSKLGQYLLLQANSRFSRGLHGLMTLEYYTEQMTMPVQRLVRFGPGVQYFPVHRFELRLDLQGARTLGADTLTADILNLIAQVHLWL